jgi:hypothetical protein
VQITLDEGGARCVDGAARSYLPFAVMADVELETRLLRAPAVVVVLTSDERRTLFVGEDSLEIHRGLVEHLAALRRHGPTPAPAWERAGRSLGAWLSAVGSDTEHGYRDAADRSMRALAILDDAQGNIDARAAAAHLLVRTAEAQVLLHTAKVVVGRPLPPIVFVAARLGHAAMVDDDTFRDAMTFIDAPDRDEASEVSADQGATRSPRHDEAVAEARRELAEEALRAPPGTRVPGSSRSEVAGASRDISRWIGKSWGL